MASKYGYYIISNFIPVYEQRLGMIMNPDVFRDKPANEAKRYYRSIRAKLPATRKIMDFNNSTSLYFLKHGINDLVMMIRATRFIDAVRAFDALRCLLALVYHSYSEDADIIPLKRRPSFSKLSVEELADLAEASNAMLFSLEIISGVQVSDRRIYDIEKHLMKAFSDQNIRRALACFYQSQNIYYTHLVGSYVAVHSRPDLIGLSAEEYRYNNFRYQEMLHASLLTCYRGIEAIYSKNFKSIDFNGHNRRRLEVYMDNKLPKTPSKSKYHLRFYRQRESHAPKYKLLVNMLEVLFRARNRAAHGYRWRRRYRDETFGSDLVDEAKFFLGHLISGALT